MYGMYLNSKRCKVYHACDGREGIDQAIDLRPDLIILDLAMPRVDGWTVLTQLRTSSWTADLPIVIVTALSDARDEALCLGADAYLVKPCTPEVLWCQIRGLFRAPSHLRARLPALS
jgi:two-component system response regulator AdeR